MRIVVPLDGSVFAETAIPHALGLLDGGTLALVTAVDPPLEPLVGVPDLDTMMLSTSTRYLEEVAALLPKGVEAETHVLGRPVTAVLSQFATESKADLIVMSTHGRGPASRFWLGSVADRLTRMSPVPVYLVRPGEDSTERPALNEPVPAPDKILVSVDGSELSEQALPATALLGKNEDQTLHLLRVASYPAFFASGYMPDTIVTNREVAADRLANAESYVEELATKLRGEGGTVLPKVVSAEFIAPAVLEYAKSCGAGAIVASTHGHSGFTRMLLGSVADKIVRASALPVLLVQASDPES